MKKPVTVTVTKVKKTPSNDLFIYYLEGIIHPTIPIPHPHFLGNWVEETSTFLFFGTQADETVKELCRTMPHLVFIDRYEMDHEQWQGGDTAPFTAGELTVTPFRKGAPPKGAPGPRGIFLDSGVVFGNGSHPTTNVCLNLLEKMGPSLAKKTIQDLGTGTGLLALGAARLGAPRVLAVDLNHLAVQTTAENARVNGLSGQILAIQGRAEEMIFAPADLVVANIHYDIMKEIVISEGFLGKREAILSGLMTTEAQRIEERLLCQGRQITRYHSADGIWHTFHVKSG